MGIAREPREPRSEFTPTRLQEKGLRPSEPELIRASLTWDFDGFVSFYPFYRDQVRAHVNHMSRDVSELLIYVEKTSLWDAAQKATYRQRISAVPYTDTTVTAQVQRTGFGSPAP